MLHMYNGQINFFSGDSRDLSFIPDESIQLVVTSPPYPMISMWDDLFVNLEPEVASGLDEGRGMDVFEGMHKSLDPVWKECFRTLIPGGFLCLNIGDAVRTLGGSFQLYSNHSRILSSCSSAGFQILPPILWRKPTNAPNKFMGSGMLPAGAYVTLEHEYILILRKGGKRNFVSESDRIRRRRSAYFWEERNAWFSDIWTLPGTGQNLSASEPRERSAAFPLELAHRIIHMYSVQGDTVLDPFLGTGTTLLASLSSGREGIGVEIEPKFISGVLESCYMSKDKLNELISKRLENHLLWIKERLALGKVIKYRNNFHDFPVITRQERELVIPFIKKIVAGENSLNVCWE